jgi:CRP/FNR family cyclic AMP-dependent transcriptional regulator
MENVPELGKRFPALERLDEDDLAALAGRLETRVLSSGDVLIREDEPSDSAWLVWDGVVTVSIGVGNERVQLGRGLAGSVVGEVSFLDGSMPSATVKASAPTVAYGLSRSGFEALARENPRAAAAVHLALCRTLGEHLRHANERLAKLQLGGSTVGGAEEEHGLLDALKGLFGLE